VSSPTHRSSDIAADSWGLGSGIELLPNAGLTNADGSRRRPTHYGCENVDMAARRRRITITEPGVAGSYELVERRDDG
jgi:hypothetical protein